MVSERERGQGIESGERGSLWPVVLAGGEGTTLRPLPGLTWCDLGSPERVVTMLTRLGVSAPWLATYPA
jgi:hypothetical protein